MGRKIKLSENIGLQLKEFRTKYKVKGKDIAELLGKSPAYVSKLEKGQIQQIEKDELVKITNYITQSNEGYYLFCEKIAETADAKELDHDCRVIKMEGHNAREIVPEWFDESIDFMCMDVSFISCKTILEHVLRVLSIRHIAILVKPQFECGPTALNKHGVLKNSKLALQIVEDVKSFLFQYYRSVEAMPSILEGRSGNQEYMVYAKDLRIS